MALRAEAELQAVGATGSDGARIGDEGYGGEVGVAVPETAPVGMRKVRAAHTPAKPLSSKEKFLQVAARKTKMRLWEGSEVRHRSWCLQPATCTLHRQCVRFTSSCVYWLVPR